MKDMYANKENELLRMEKTDTIMNKKMKLRNV